MTFHIVMKDGTHRAYDGVFEIRESRGVIFIRYYSAHSAKLTAEHALSKIQHMYYGTPYMWTDAVSKTEVK